MAPDLSFEESGGDALPGLGKVEAALPGQGDLEGGQGGDGEVGMDWQDIGEFEREQEVVQGEIGARSNVVVDEGVVAEGRAGEEVQRVRDGRIDKEARKKAKKDKRKQQKREKDAKLKRDRDAER